MNQNRRKIPDVTTGSIERHLVRLAIPTIGGMFAITVFNLTDTYFVSRLGTDALAAMGFTFPVVMLVCAVLNAILDPIMIFGLFGFPAMGIAGASLATIISRFAGMITTLSFIHFHYGLLDFRYRNFGELIESWRRILHIGLPAALVRLFPQVLRAVLTRIAAGVGGVAAVAAVAAGSRIESFILIISMAIGTALVPIIGQNWGAGRFDRVDRARLVLNRAAVAYGLLAFTVMAAFSGPITRIFSADPEVVVRAQWYLRILAVGSAGLNLYNWTSEELSAAGKPSWVVGINVAGTSLILIPLTIVGSRIFGFHGMLIGLCLGQLILGVLATRIGRSQLRGPTMRTEPATA